MRKAALFAVGLLVAACSPTTARDTASSAPRLDAFDFGTHCPHVCWLGINPGSTSAEDASAMIKRSESIDQEVGYAMHDDVIQAIWYVDVSNRYRSNVYISLQRQRVESISLGKLAPFRLGEMVAKLGEPGAIRIGMDHTVDGGDILGYALYFPARAASIYVYPGNPAGPDPKDFINTLVLNASFQYPKRFADTPEQRWLGYGRIREYLTSTGD